MAVQLIASSDKLQSGFRAKYNSSVNEIIVSVVDNGDGTATFTKFGGGTLTIDLTDSFFTKTEVGDLIAGLIAPRQPVEYEFDQDDIQEDGTGTGNWYIDYRQGSGGAAVPDGVMPYNVATTYDDPDDPGETVTQPIPALIYDKSTYTYPRIYGFPDPATDQTITIFAI